MTSNGYTLEDTASGRNAFYVSCKVQSQTVAYCACLNRQRTVDSGLYPADWAACKDAARNRECKALQMRQDEMVQGIGLFFKERPNLSESTASAAPEGYFTSKDVPASKSKRGAKKGLLDVVASGVGSTYADAVSAAAASHAVAVSGAKPSPAATLPAPAECPKEAPKPVTASVSMNPGESVAQFLARIRNQSATPALV